MDLATFFKKLLAALSKTAPKTPVSSVDGGEDKSYIVDQLFLGNVDLIKAHEGLRLEAYLPTPNDVWTIGYGHTKTAKQGMRITQAGAEALLKHDLAWVEATLKLYIEVPLTQNQYDALASFVYNLGATNFKNSTLLKMLNKGDYQGAADQLLRWDKQKGKVLRGLSIRRSHERDLFLT
jgi:GH24 family phage-related lysozyme (muramidase)